ncbi:integral membrane protein [Euzebya pacifica]|uniref:Transport permease protein n=1 Tax=Euzebya pacifica TaxID=1608957 RepID=A0A346XU72_9ACTN|nr:ABC transporter permease [Euzebya pacifica]AXV05769.1 integral membrane protein [Euzebya pacifica]
MTALTTLTRAQIKVFLREPVAVGFGLVFPAVLLLVIGNVFPGATEVSPALGNKSLVEIYAPAAAVLGLLTLGIAMLPQALGLDRERGILRRLAVTPAHPGLLVGAHLVVQAVAVTIGTAGAVLVGVLAFDLPVPQRPGWFLLAFVLSCAALLSIGALLGALVPTAQTGVGAGMLLYFPMLFFAGIYLPLEIMPEGLQAFSARTPPGAAVQALSDAWAGATPTATSLLVLVATTIVAGGLATRFFRWE